MPDIPAVDTHLLRQDVHHAFHGELGLVAAKPSHRAAVGIVGVDGLGFDVDVRNAVRTARMARCAQGALGARRVIPPGIHKDPRPDGDQAPFRISADGKRHRHRVALHVMLGGLLPRQNRLDRPAQEVRGEGRVGLDR